MPVYTYQKTYTINHELKQKQLQPLWSGPGSPVAANCSICAEWIVNKKENEYGGVREERLLALSLQFSQIRIKSFVQGGSVTFIESYTPRSASWKINPTTLGVGAHASIPFQNVKMNVAQLKTVDRYFHVLVTLEMGNPPVNFAPVVPPDLFHTSHTSDVELFFPREHVSLWAHSSLLKAASPYFAALLTDDFTSNVAAPPSPAKPQSKKGAKKAVKMDVKPELEEDYGVDSDEEDEYRKNHPALRSNNATSSTCTVPPRYTVQFKQCRAITFLAVLSWISTGNVDFSPLLSRPELLPGGERIKVSPKSVYALATLLQIESLQNVALYAFDSQLYISNAANELYSEASGKHKQIRDLAIAFACKHWKVVGSTAGMIKILDEMKDGKLPHQQAIGSELLRKLAQV